MGGVGPIRTAAGLRLATVRARGSSRRASANTPDGQREMMNSHLRHQQKLVLTVVLLSDVQRVLRVQVPLQEHSYASKELWRQCDRFIHHQRAL